MVEKMNYEDLLFLREYYDLRWGELLFSQGLQNLIKENIEAETPLPVELSYGGGMNIPEVHDEGFYERNGIVPINIYDKMFDLLREEQEAEFQLRRERIRNYIGQLGFGDQTSEIINGMNKTAQRVVIPVEDVHNSHPFVLRTVMQSNSDSLLDFGLRYVERWKDLYDKFCQP